MFDGFTSRWMTPAWWAWCRASPASAMTLATDRRYFVERTISRGPTGPAPPVSIGWSRPRLVGSGAGHRSDELRASSASEGVSSDGSVVPWCQASGRRGAGCSLDVRHGEIRGRPLLRRVDRHDMCVVQPGKDLCSRRNRSRVPAEGGDGRPGWSSPPRGAGMAPALPRRSPPFPPGRSGGRSGVAQSPLCSAASAATGSLITRTWRAPASARNCSPLDGWACRIRSRTSAGVVGAFQLLRNWMTTSSTSPLASRRGRRENKGRLRIHSWSSSPLRIESGSRSVILRPTRFLGLIAL